MTPLEERLILRIQATGPITLAEYMSACLLDPEHGYYATREVFGAGGDFTTAPEISQMFGELIGLSLAQAWLEQGAPSLFRLCEIGPGRGTLMADLLRATRGVPGFHAALDLWLVEAGAARRKEQAATLKDYAVNWTGSLSDVPEGPLFLVANEFFDALPVRQFERSGAGWRERVVGLSEGKLVLGLGLEAGFAQLEHRVTDTVDGDIVELCPSLSGIASEIGGRIARAGGAALLIDYGDWRSLGDTVQAVQNHQSVPILEAPGEVDLTAHVDFEPLSRALVSSGAVVSQMTPQGVWLERLGITDRAQALARGLSDPAQLDVHIQAHRRLTHPGEMGSLFKVLGVCTPGAPPLPGLPLSKSEPAQ